MWKEQEEISLNCAHILQHRDYGSIRTKLLHWAIWQARAGCYSQAALSSNDSKTLYSAIRRTHPRCRCINVTKLWLTTNPFSTCAAHQVRAPSSARCAGRGSGRRRRSAATRSSTPTRSRTSAPPAGRHSTGTKLFSYVVRVMKIVTIVAQIRASQAPHLNFALCCYNTVTFCSLRP